MARKILLADDDVDVREGLGRLLRFEGYETVLAGDGRTALDLLGVSLGVSLGLSLGVPDDASAPDLVLMDVTMPELDGLAATRRIRASGSTVPILMITGRDAVGDRIVALDNGADDYLSKPFAVEELLARVRALLRRGAQRNAADEHPPELERLVFQDLVMDLRTRTVARDGLPLDLTRTEFLLLEYLLRHPGAALTRSQIHRHVGLRLRARVQHP